MSIMFRNKTKRLVIIRLNSGRSLFIEPGTVSREIEDDEVSKNTMVQKLQDRQVIAVHSHPAVNDFPLEQSSAALSVTGIEKPDQKKNNKKQKKSKTKGGK